MGLHVPVAEAIVAEHAFRRIEGDVLFIGRQTVFLNEESLTSLLQRYGVELPLDFEFEFDQETRGGATGRFITDRCFMKSLGVDNVKFLDVTDYEGADIVHDLGYPVPATLIDRFDFIYNGGCLDNMFNPGVAIVNLSKMLRENGRVVCFESASSFNSPYLIYSPGWFWDYYVTNAFIDCKIYLGSFYEGHDFQFGPWKLYYVNPSNKSNNYQQLNGQSPAPRANNHFAVISIAEKGAESSSENQPIQYQYRVDEGLKQRDGVQAERMLSSSRPLMLQRGQKSNSNSYLTYLGKISSGIHKQPAPTVVTRSLRRYARAIKNILIILFDKSVS